MKRLAYNVLVVAALLFSFAVAVSYPLVVTDDLGRTVRLEQAPQRIIAMMPSHTETVCALDACQLLVGVDQFSNYPDEAAALPRLGSGFSPNVEQIVALQPDLVLVDEYSTLAATLEQLGLAVYAGTAETYDDVFEKFELIGRLIDRETSAALLSGRVQGAVRAIAERVAAAPSPSVYYELDATPYTVGPNSFIGELISKAGGDNIVTASFGDYPQLDPEFIVASDPEVIILADAPYGESLETLRQRPGWDQIQALQEERIIELEQEQVDTLNRPGPRLAQGVKLLAEILHPDLF